jgi:O-antigen ligase
VVGISIGFLTIYDSSARGSLVALAAGMLLVTVFAVQKAREPQTKVALAVLVVLLGTCTLFPSYVGNTTMAVANDLLKLDDPTRGVGQGFTGRDVIWAETFDIWLRAPVLGVGFRQHEKFLHVAGHNAYLAMLADTGLVGFIAYMWLLGLAFVSSARSKARLTRGFVAPLLIAYAVLGLFERRAINVGNPLGVLFLLCCFYALMEREFRKAGFPEPPNAFKGEPAPVALEQASPAMPAP